MHDTPASGHPLHTARFDDALVTGAVLVLHAPGEPVSNRFEAAMGMVGKAGNVVVRIVAAEGIEHQERVKPPLQVAVQHAGEAHAGAVGCLFADHLSLDATGLLNSAIHGDLLVG
jgi:hypothetical protein